MVQLSLGSWRIFCCNDTVGILFGLVFFSCFALSIIYLLLLFTHAARMLILYKAFWTAYMLLWILNNNCLVLLPEVLGYKQLTYSQVELFQLRSSILCKEELGKEVYVLILHVRLRKRPFRPLFPPLYWQMYTPSGIKLIYCMPNAGWSRPSEMHASSH